MNRLHLTFACGSLTLSGTLDTAPGQTGLLIVSGGNETRSGAFSGQAHLAAKIAKAGFPVFRFDRRGVGDSEGENRGFRSSQRDIASALTSFRAMAPDLDRVFAFGNCDGASALLLSRDLELDGLILSNPWIEQDKEHHSDLSIPAAAIRKRYAQKLRNPSEVIRLLSGGVSLKKLAKGLTKSVGPRTSQTELFEEMEAGVDAFNGPVRILLATEDRTAQQFDEAWKRTDIRIKRCGGAGHAYSEPDHAEWLKSRILDAMRT
ncbi:MAG: hydrolase 1, exosortase A system-associated [Pseudomonadota bacterium]